MKLTLTLLLVALLAGCVQQQGDQIVWGIPPIEPGNMNVPTPSGEQPTPGEGQQGAAPSTPTAEGGHPGEDMGVIGTGEPDNAIHLPNNITITIDYVNCKLINKQDFSPPFEAPPLWAYDFAVTAGGTVSGPVGTSAYAILEGAKGFSKGGGWAGNGFPDESGLLFKAGWSGSTPDYYPGACCTQGDVREEGDPETTSWTFYDEIHFTGDPADFNPGNHVTFRASTSMINDEMAARYGALEFPEMTADLTCAL
jgi:hypothetical protein